MRGVEVDPGPSVEDFSRAVLQGKTASKTLAVPLDKAAQRSSIITPDQRCNPDSRYLTYPFPVAILEYRMHELVTAFGL